MLLTPQPCFGHVVCLVVDPLGAVRADVGLRGGVGHRVIADPGCQVDVESIWVNDSIRIHQTLLSQLQNGKELEAFQNKFAYRALAIVLSTNGLEMQHTYQEGKSKRT